MRVASSLTPQTLIPSSRPPSPPSRSFPSHLPPPSLSGDGGMRSSFFRCFPLLSYACPVLLLPPSAPCHGGGGPPVSTAEVGKTRHAGRIWWGSTGWIWRGGTGRPRHRDGAGQWRRCKDGGLGAGTAWGRPPRRGDGAGRLSRRRDGVAGVGAAQGRHPRRRRIWPGAAGSGGETPVAAKPRGKRAPLASGLPPLLLLCPDRGRPGPRRRRQLDSEGVPAASAPPQRRHGLEVTAALSSLGRP